MTIRYVPASGSPTANGSALTTAIGLATYGDEITLDAGGVYQGNWFLPDKGAGSLPIIIRPVDMSPFPAGVRVTRSQIASFPRLETNNASPIFEVQPNAHHWTLEGLNLTATHQPYLNGSSAPRLIGDNGGMTLETVPHDIVIDRCLIHPFETDPDLYRGVAKGIMLDGSNITITNNDIYDFMGFAAPEH